MGSRASAAALVGALVICLCDAARAQAPPASTETRLDEVVVVANRTPEPLSAIGNSVTVLDAAAIRASQTVVLSDLLAQTPGINAARAGGVGQPTSVFIRGAESDHTVVVIDGVLMNDPSLTSGGYDFRDLLVGDTARIEILRGAQSTLYGSQAIGGVINIISAQPSRGFEAGGSAEGGSHDTGYFTAALGGKSDALLWRVSGNYYTTSGIPCIDPQFGGHRPCASELGGGSARLRYDFTPDLQLDVRGYIVHGRADFDGYDTPTGNFGDDREYGTTVQYIAYAGLTYSSADRAFTHRVSVQETDSETRNYDPDAPLSYGSSSTQTYYGIGRNLRAEYQGTWAFASQSHLVFGAQHERSTIDTDTPAFDFTPMPVNKYVYIDSGYAQVQSEVAPGLTLTGGGRYDRHDVYGGHWTGQLAAAWALNERDTILRASFGQGFKAPSLYQLYSNYGNLALRPETANGWDAGIEQHALDERLVASATYFERDSRDLINFFDCSTPSPLCATEPFGYYANIARTLARGVELVAGYNPTSELGVEINYTYTTALDRSPGAPTYGNDLPRRPRQMGNAALNYRTATGLCATLAARYSSRAFDDAANQVPLGGYVLLDVRMSYALREGLEIYGRVENVTDRHYETAYQYATLGRVGYFGVRAQF